VPVGLEKIYFISLTHPAARRSPSMASNPSPPSGRSRCTRPAATTAPESRPTSPDSSTPTTASTRQVLRRRCRRWIRARRGFPVRPRAARRWGRGESKR
jgi:hypothetical protein